MASIGRDRPVDTEPDSRNETPEDDVDRPPTDPSAMEHRLAALSPGPTHPVPHARSVPAAAELPEALDAADLPGRSSPPALAVVAARRAATGLPQPPVSCDAQLPVGQPSLHLALCPHWRPVRLRWRA